MGLSQNYNIHYYYYSPDRIFTQIHVGLTIYSHHYTKNLNDKENLAESTTKKHLDIILSRLYYFQMEHKTPNLGHGIANKRRPVMYICVFWMIFLFF